MTAYGAAESPALELAQAGRPPPACPDHGIRFLSIWSKSP
jgi:hypothetical protein